MRRRYTDQNLMEAVQASVSIAQVLKILRLSPTGCNYKAMHEPFPESVLPRLGVRREVRQPALVP